MHTTIDAAGRVVIPKSIRERAGLYAGAQIDISVDGDEIRLVPDGPSPRVERRGRLVFVVRPERPDAETAIDDTVGAETVNDETVQSIRDRIAAERVLGIRIEPDP